MWLDLFMFSRSSCRRGRRLPHASKRTPSSSRPPSRSRCTSWTTTTAGPGTSLVTWGDAGGPASATSPSSSPPRPATALSSLSPTAPIEKPVVHIMFSFCADDRTLQATYFSRGGWSIWGGSKIHQYIPAYRCYWPTLSFDVPSITSVTAILFFVLILTVVKLQKFHAFPNQWQNKLSL